MSGWPNRVGRTSFGPTLEDKFPVVNPKHDIGARPLNLQYWQVAGMNTTASRGLMEVSTSGAGADTGYQGFAWDPDGTLPKVAWTRTAQGIFEFSLPQAEYLDADGNLVTVDIVGGQAIPQETHAGNIVIGQYERTGVRSGRVHMYVPQTLDKQDVNFICVLW